MSRKWEKILSLIVLVATVLMISSCGGAAPAPAAQQAAPAAQNQPASQQAAPAAYDPTWAKKPMDKLTTVVLSVEAGAQEALFKSYADQVKKDLNIDLQVVAHPFSEQYEIQYLDLSSGAAQFDVLSYWPLYMADFEPFLYKLKDIAPGGEAQVVKDIAADDILDGYKWCWFYDGNWYGVQYDGDTKIWNYRHDLATDPKEMAAFKTKYGYDLNVNNMTWDNYTDIAKFFQRPAENFYGTAEIAGFLGGWDFKDRLVGMGGHLFDDKMKAFGGVGATGEKNMDICLKAVKQGQDMFNNAMAPEAHSFEFEDARNQIIVQGRAFFTPQWPDVWKWSNDLKQGNKDKAYCKVYAADAPGFKDASGKVVHRPEENGGRTLTISKNTKVKEAAYKFLVFMADPARSAQVVFNNNDWNDPYRISHLDVKNMGDIAKDCPDNRQAYLDLIKTQTKEGYPALQIPGAGRYNEVMERWAKKAWANQTTPQEACDGMTKEMDQITADIGVDKQVKAYAIYIDNMLKPKNLWP